MRVQDLMSQPAVTCHVNDSLNVAAKLMWDHDCGAIPVVRDDGTLSGMITDRDICMAAHTQGRSLDDMLVNGAMTKHVISVHADQKAEVAEQLMARHQVHRIPVVDPEDKPIGLLSINDLATESAKPEARIKNGLVKVAQTLAAICRPRTEKRKAA